MMILRITRNLPQDVWAPAWLVFLPYQSASPFRTRAFFDKVWNGLNAAGIPFTLHWGNTFLTAARVRHRYGGAVDQ
jgi:hypothetical protein